MNLYVQTMNAVIDHIEEQISEPLTLQNIARQFYLSEFHFSRLFKIITGVSLKQYILGRKLSLASGQLKVTDVSVTDIAYEYGFEHPEVFSRAFKKQFGISPVSYRNGNHNVSTIPKAFIVERDIMNFGGILTLKESYIQLNELDLFGMTICVDETSSDFDDVLRSAGEKFIADKYYSNNLNTEHFYSVVNCHGDDSGQYTVFFGGECKNGSQLPESDVRHIPAGWYACFSYHGKMTDMRTTFIEDFYRWVIVKEIEPCPNGIGMIDIYDRCNVENVKILVPVKEPK